MSATLSITYYRLLPIFSGGQKTVVQFSSFLGKKVPLYVVSTQDNDANSDTNFTLLPIMRKSAVRYLDFTIIGKLKKLIKEKNIQTVLLEHTHLGWIGWLLRKKTGVKLLIHTHNIEYERYRSIGRWWWPIMMWYEKWVLKTADHLFCISEADMHFMHQKLGISKEKTTLVPFGVPIAQLPSNKAACRETLIERHQLPKSGKIILFAGWLGYEPNDEAVGIIVHQINRLLQKTNLNYTILVCGKDLSEKYLSFKNEKNMQYVGFVPDIETYFKGADLFINPILQGGGVKTKLVEAISFNTNAVSTVSGAAGVELSICEKKLVTVTDYNWEAFTQQIVEQLAIVADTPYDFYTKHYWGHIIARIQQFFQKAE
ncbi:MAG: glycosyltransferase family 4 protein [Chitinophagaceae bacterium]